MYFVYKHHMTVAGYDITAAASLSFLFLFNKEASKSKSSLSHLYPKESEHLALFDH